MGLPGHRRTSSHKRRRASHFALKKINLQRCPKCKAVVMSHQACKECGTYAGRQVLTMASPLAKGKKAVKGPSEKTAKAAKSTVKADQAHPHHGESGHEGHDHGDHNH